MLDHTYILCNNSGRATLQIVQKVMKMHINLSFYHLENVHKKSRNRKSEHGNMTLKMKKHLHSRQRFILPDSKNIPFGKSKKFFLCEKRYLWNHQMPLLIRFLHPFLCTISSKTQIKH